MCKRLPIKAVELKIPTPRTIYDRCATVEYASLFLRLSCLRASSDPAKMVTTANTIRILFNPNFAMVAGPKINMDTRIIPNTPALTTATACRRALTGVGAAMAVGSQLCKGMMEAFTPTPAIKRKKRGTAVPAVRASP